MGPSETDFRIQKPSPRGTVTPLPRRWADSARTRSAYMTGTEMFGNGFGMGSWTDIIADFHGRKLTLTWTNVRANNLPIFKSYREVVQPWDRKALPIQFGLAKDRVMATAVEMDHDPLGLKLHRAGGLDEFAKDLLGCRAAEPLQAVCQPA